MSRSLSLLVMIALCLSFPVAHGIPPEQAGPRWYKGNLHTHSLWSDGDDFPENIAIWYRDNGYDFLAMSDHNTAQDGEKWVKYADVQKKGAGPAFDRYVKNHPDRAQVRGEREKGTQEVRLSPFEEYRPLVEQPGRFLLMPGEEISDKGSAHVGGINLGETIKPRGGRGTVQVIRNNLKAIQEQGKRLGRPVLGHVNHPNFHWAVSAEMLAEIVEEPFFEVYNGHPGVRHLGDQDHPSVERLWDIANTLRLTAFKAPPMMGIATDDSHHHHAKGAARANPGRGWICVRAASLTPGGLFEAMRAGEFYGSSGVVLTELKYDPAAGTLELEIAPDGDARFTTQFIGTLKGIDMATEAQQVGTVLATVEGLKAAYRLTGNELYVRAMVMSDQAPKNPGWKEQRQQAWTQPVGWERQLEAGEGTP